MIFQTETIKMDMICFNGISSEYLNTILFVICKIKIDISKNNTY